MGGKSEWNAREAAGIYPLLQTSAQIFLEKDTLTEPYRRDNRKAHIYQGPALRLLGISSGSFPPLYGEYGPDPKKFGHALVEFIPQKFHPPEEEDELRGALSKVVKDELAKLDDTVEKTTEDIADACDTFFAFSAKLDQKKIAQTATAAQPPPVSATPAAASAAPATTVDEQTGGSVEPTGGADASTGGATPVWSGSETPTQCYRRHMATFTLAHERLTKMRGLWSKLTGRRYVDAPAMSSGTGNNRVPILEPALLKLLARASRYDVEVFFNPQVAAVPKGSGKALLRKQALEIYKAVHKAVEDHERPRIRKAFADDAEEAASSTFEDDLKEFVERVVVHDPSSDDLSFASIRDAAATAMEKKWPDDAAALKTGRGSAAVDLWGILYQLPGKEGLDDDSCRGMKNSRLDLDREVEQSADEKVGQKGESEIYKRLYPRAKARAQHNKEMDEMRTRRGYWKKALFKALRVRASLGWGSVGVYRKGDCAPFNNYEDYQHERHKNGNYEGADLLSVCAGM